VGFVRGQRGVKKPKKEGKDLTSSEMASGQWFDRNGHLAGVLDRKIFERGERNPRRSGGVGGRRGGRKKMGGKVFLLAGDRGLQGKDPRVPPG